MKGSFLAGRSALAATVLVAGVAAALALLRPEADASQPATLPEAGHRIPVAVKAVSAETGYAVHEVHAGRVVPRRTSDLGFERAGRLTEVACDEGARVREGDVLARLDVRELRARRDEALARRRGIESRLALARVTTERRRTLHESGHLADQRLDETVHAQEGLEAELAASDAAIENLDVQLELSILRAPFAGTISQRFADEGAVVSPGEPLLRLLEDGALEVHVGVPPRAAGRLAPGAIHTIEIAGVRVEGRLTSVLPTVEADTRTVRVIFALDAPPSQVRSGALARVALESRVAAEGFWVPLTALSEARRGLWSAYVLVEEGGEHRVERRQLEVVHAAADRAFVRGTLRDGDVIVSDGVHRLVPGQRVRPVRGETGSDVRSARDAS